MRILRLLPFGALTVSLVLTGFGPARPARSEARVASESSTTVPAEGAPQAADAACVFTTSSKELAGSRGDPGVKTRYDVPSGGRLTGTYVLQNPSPKMATYTVFGLLDYVAIPLSETSTDTVRQVTLEPNQGVLIPFETPPLADGRHDFTIAAIASPNVAMSANDRRLTDTAFYYPQRASIVVGSGESRPASGTKIEVEPRANPQGFGWITLNRDSSSAGAEWLEVSARPGETITAYAHVGNDTATRQDYALTGLVGRDQARIGGATVAMVSLEPSRTASVPVTIRAPEAKGRYEVFVLRARAPFVLQPENPKDANDQWIDTTLRVLLTVE